jgi:hypothetical protein
MLNFDDYQKKINCLYAEFPLCFPNPPICGFSIENGWFEIVRDLCSKIEPLIASVPEDERAEFCIDQVKEKFGCLRFYTGGHIREDVYKQINDLIREAEISCNSICEFCGKPGTIRKGGWLKTLCDDCEKNRQRKRYIAHRDFIIHNRANNICGGTLDTVSDDNKKSIMQEAEEQLIAEGCIKPLNQY